MSEQATPQAPAGRLLSLDVFRGATIMAMILVNNPGKWGHLYWPVGHAEWHGWTPTDLIFPFFMFIMGTAMAYSFRKYRHGEIINPTVWLRIGRRACLLIFLGLLLNCSGQITRYFLGQQEAIDLSGLRWPGVLQRIGLAYLIAAPIVLFIRTRGCAALTLAILLLYAGLLGFLPTDISPTERLGTTDNVVRQIDLALIGKSHMYTKSTSEPTDPEGLLSTLPSVATVLLGYLAGLMLQAGSKLTTAKLLGLGVVLAGAGLLLHEVGIPINKKLWTSSFVLLTGGLGMVILAGCYWLFDVFGKQTNWASRLALPFQLVGVNAIFVFVASGIVGRLLVTFQMAGAGDEMIPLKSWLYSSLFESWITEPKLASLAFAVATVTFWWLLLAAMWRKGWAIRI